MKRLRGACKGCKCAYFDGGKWSCEVDVKVAKAPIKTCGKRIDAEKYADKEEKKE